MLISHSNKFIYYAPQKTGTTSLHKILVEEFDAELLGERHDIFLPSEYQDYYVFCSVRNPYTRAISAFNEIRRKRDVNISECFDINEKHWARPIYVSLFERPTPDGCVSIHVDSFIHTENLCEEFNLLPFVNRPISVPILNKSDGYRIAYGCQIYEWVKNFYKKDFEFFGYSDEWVDLGLKIM